MKTLVIVPAYNVEKSIAGLLREISKSGADVLSIDDCSKDNTLNEIRKVKKTRVLHNAKNSGKGSSLRKGFGYALKRKYELVVMLDGDGQHNPAEIRKFISKSKTYDLVIGNRMGTTRRMPLIRRLVNSMDSWIVTQLSGAKVKDAHCGYRAIRTDLLRKLKLESNRFEIEVEMVLKAAKKKATIGNVDIECIYNGQNSSIHPLIDTLRLMRIMARNI